MNTVELTREEIELLLFEHSQEILKNSYFVTDGKKSEILLRDNFDTPKWLDKYLTKQIKQQPISPFTGIVLKVSNWKTSTKGGKYKEAFIRSLIDGKTYLLYAYEEHTKSKKFLPFLVPQAILENLHIFKDNLISGSVAPVFKGLKGDK